MKKKENKEDSKAKKIYQIIVSIFTLFFFILAIYIFISTIVAKKNNTMTSIFGYTYSVVPTESMKPIINPGDSVVGKKVKYETLELGDDVIYYNDELGIFIVHRIIGSDENGFIVKGVNNPVQDEIRVTEDNYIAKVVWHGTFANIGELVVNNRGTIFLLLVAVLMLIAGNGIFDIIRIINEKKNKDQVEHNPNNGIPSEEELRRQVLEELENEKKLKESNESDINKK